MVFESWERVDELYHAAFERDPREREAFLEAACSGEVAVLEEVRSLLSCSEEVGEFLDQPVSGALIEELTSRSGTRLGQYEVCELIGMGGMGDVYRARDTRLGRDVALKVLPEGSSRGRRRDRIADEACALASLSHPGIATLHAFEERDETSFLVMELVAGGTLADRFAQGPAPIRESLALLRQLAAALEAAHAKGIVHRDLKPANVGITTRGDVKLLDFGLALTAAVPPGVTTCPATPGEGPSPLAAGGVLGTPAYMSPEQVRGEPLDCRTDVWSFGCLLYEALSGVRPFVGESVSETIAGVLTEVPDWSQLPAGTPESIRSLLRRCLAKDRRERPHDISEARSEIDVALAAAPTEAEAAWPELRLSRSSRRGTRWALAALTAAHLLVAAWLLAERFAGDAGAAARDVSPPARPHLVLLDVPASLPSSESVAAP